MKGSTKKQETATINYDVKVTRAKEVKEGHVAFDMIVNGVTIYGCFYREGEKDGKPYQFISFPSKKADNGKYYNHVWFKIDPATEQDIIAQLQELV